MLQKVENFKSAVAQLKSAVEQYRRSPEDTLYRDGLIQRFEFTFELAWKSLREYLEDQGADMSGIVLSKQVFKASYAAQVIDNQQVWLDMLNSRNLTSHIYDEKTASQIAQQISQNYIGPLVALAEFYRKQ